MTLRPCHSPYCECDLGKCTHPGCYDARHLPLPATMSNTNKDYDILMSLTKDMQPLFERARKEKLWFYTPYQGIWFSPRELAIAQAEGRFMWSAQNWQLANPVEHLEQLDRERARAESVYEQFRERLAHD